MKYLLMIYGNDEVWDSWSARERQDILRAHADLQRDLVAAGELVGSEGLTTVGARTVRLSGGAPAVTDGPFTEAKEVLAGYYLVECDSVERATEIAARLPEARYSPIEVRRIMDPSEFGMETPGLFTPSP